MMKTSYSDPDHSPLISRDTMANRRACLGKQMTILAEANGEASLRDMRQINDDYDNPTTTEADDEGYLRVLRWVCRGLSLS